MAASPRPVSFRPRYFITGGQTGADSIPLSVYRELGLQVRGYLPRDARRADGKGWDVIQAHEGLWEGWGGHAWRDWANAGMSDALVAFLTTKPKTGKGTMSTVNVFVNGEFKMEVLRKPDAEDWMVIAPVCLAQNDDQSVVESDQRAPAGANPSSNTPNIEKGETTIQLLDEETGNGTTTVVAEVYKRKRRWGRGAQQKTPEAKLSTVTKADVNQKEVVDAGREICLSNDEHAVTAGRELKSFKGKKDFPWSHMRPKYESADPDVIGRRPVLIFWDLTPDKIVANAEILRKFLNRWRPDNLMFSGPLETTWPNIEVLGAQLLRIALTSGTDNG